MPKISQYPAVTTPADTDVLVVVQGGVTKKVTLATLKTTGGFSPYFKNNLEGSGAPGAGDDSADGYGAGSVWIDRTASPMESYRCADATVAAAIWLKTTLTIDELGSGAVRNIEAATAENDMLFGGPSPFEWVRKTLAQAKAILGLDYKTIFIPASAMTPTATNGATGGSSEYATNDINMDYLLFAGDTEKFAEFQLPMPEDWDRGTIKAKAFWSSDTGSTAGDTVEWEIAAGALSDDDAIDAALGTAQVISDALLADNGTDMQISGATPALTVGGTPALGDLVHFKVSRNVGGTDDMAENARLFGVWIQYKATNTVAAW